MNTSHDTESSRHRLKPTLAVLLAVLLALATACAYYNMLYNAKKMYKTAEVAPRDREGKPTRRAIQLYDDVIEKCQTMIGTYPKSRHVDDAMLLIARCLHGQHRYLEAAGQLDSLEVKFPETELLPEVRFLKGRVLAEAEYYEESIEILEDYVERFPDHESVAHAYYFLATSSMSLGRENDAVSFIGVLEDRFEDSEHTFNARIEVARILRAGESWEKSRALYEALNSQRLPKDYRWSVWMGLAAVYIGVEEYAAALDMLNEVLKLRLDPEQKPVVLLEKAKAYEGMDSTDTAIETYKDITVLFGKGAYGAEAHFRLGQIWEERDSLELARNHYQKVPGAYAESEHASESIRRAGNISRLLKLQAAEAEDSPEAKALRQFTLAELQLLQFENATEALKLYEELLSKYPSSEYAPKAAYAVGYIYKTVFGDTTRAREAYALLKRRYPDTPQAVHAGYFVGKATPDSAYVKPRRAVKPDSLRAPSARPDTATVKENG